MRKFCVAVFDMDGTLLEQESSWVAVHRYFGTEALGKRSLELYTKGKIDYKEFMKRDIMSWPRNLTRQKIEEILSSFKLRKEAKQTISRLKKLGIEPVMITSGLDIVASKVSRELGIEKWVANSLVFDEMGRICNEGIAKVEPLRKDKVLLKIINEMNIRPEQTIGVGDTVYDLSFLKKVGLGFIISNSLKVEEPNIITIGRLDEIFSYI